MITTIVSFILGIATMFGVNVLAIVVKKYFPQLVPFLRRAEQSLDAVIKEIDATPEDNTQILKRIVDLHGSDVAKDIEKRLQDLRKG